MLLSAININDEVIYSSWVSVANYTQLCAIKLERYIIRFAVRNEECAAVIATAGSLVPVCPYISEEAPIIIPTLPARFRCCQCLSDYCHFPTSLKAGPRRALA
ncbi:hypothetical protein D3C86_1615130 [compost metagenome]